MTSSNSESIQRLRWQCRRGLLELDYILEAYLTEQFPLASSQEQAQFAQLLQQQDPDLQSWLLDGKQPDPGLELIVSRLRVAV